MGVACPKLKDTIAAISTPAGRGGIGIVRLSGQRAVEIAKRITRGNLGPQPLVHCSFWDEAGCQLDKGLVLVFIAPNSYTGADLVELHAHGNPVILEEILRIACLYGARLARPGEFTEWAYRNGKLDLAQAEAVADLIASQTIRAVRSAQRSLKGEFSKTTSDLIESIQELQAVVEVGIDFSEDIINSDLLDAQKKLKAKIDRGMENILKRAAAGEKLSRGATVVLVGRPNVGKSALLNRFARADRAIVSEIAGTTRDTVEIEVELNGLMLKFVDTAGLQKTEDSVEQAGIERTKRALRLADLVLVINAVTEEENPLNCESVLANCGVPKDKHLTIYNKSDLVPKLASKSVGDDDQVYVSAKTGTGIEALEQKIIDYFEINLLEDNEFTARTRHLDALQRASEELLNFPAEYLEKAPELAAEHLRVAVQALEEIGGQYTTEDMLGKIFSTFCIGK